MIEQVLDNERTWSIACGDALEVLRSMPDGCVQCVVTSPPYWGLRDYGVDGQIGMESSLEEYLVKMVEIFREVRRVLREDIGDCYSFGTHSRTSFRQDRAACNPVKSKIIPRGSGRWGGGNSLTENLPKKNLVGLPWRLAFALQADGWYLRSDIIWSKPNPMPESVKDRPTRAHEYLFLLSKAKRYFYDAAAVSERSKHEAPNSPESIKSPYGQGFARRAKEQPVPTGWNTGIGSHDTKVGRYHNKQDALDKRTYTGFNGRYQPVLKRNLRSVWSISTEPFKKAHFATFPKKLVQIPILAGTKPGDVVLDPFAGAGTTGLVALRLYRRFIGIELNPEYVRMGERRIVDDAPLLNAESV